MFFLLSLMGQHADMWRQDLPTLFPNRALNSNSVAQYSAAAILSNKSSNHTPQLHFSLLVHLPPQFIPPRTEHL